MASFWDLLPASSWPAQPYVSPSGQTLPLYGPADLTPPLPPSEEPAPSQPFATSWWDTPEDSGSVLPTLAPTVIYDANSLTGILGPLFGAKSDNANPPLAQTSPPYGVVPKNLPVERSLPLPIPDWQRPESDFAIDSPRNLARIELSLGAGLHADEIPLNDPVGRWSRDRARAAEFLFPGSGNFVSGDWNNIIGADVANLAASLATAIVPPAFEARLARAALTQVASEAETMAAAVRAAKLGAGGRQLTFPEDNRLLLYHRGLQMLGGLDPSNRLLQIRTPPAGAPSLDNIRMVNGEIKAVRQHQGLTNLENHHEFPQQFSPWFNSRGIEAPQDYRSYIWAPDHRLRENGLHAGPYSWNYRWENFILNDLSVSPDRIHQQLNEMLRQRGERP